MNLQRVISPELEAFFLAIMLEKGTPIVVPYSSDHTAATPAEARRKEEAHFLQRSAYVMHTLEIRDFMREHPGAPEIVRQLYRSRAEFGGGTNKQYTSEEEFWQWLLEHYIRWANENKPRT